MVEKPPSKSEIFSIVQAQSQTVDEFSKRLVKLEQATENQDSKNQTVIIAVLIASFLIVVTIAVQVSLSEKNDRARADDFLERVHAVETKQLELEIKQSEIGKDQQNLKDDVSSVRLKNPYLK